MYSYEYYMNGDLAEFFEEFGFALVGIVLGILLVALVIAAVFYVLQAVGLYSIAKRRGLSNAWLAWIPIGNYWILGSISDQYQYVVKGKIRNKRKILLILELCIIAVGMIMGLVSTVLLLTADGSDAVMVSTTVNLIQSLLTFGISITAAVFWYMALYDLYSSCCPESNVLFLVLSIVFSFLLPFFLFFNRKRDDGMPPRRPEPRYIPPQQTWDAPDHL